MCQILAHHDAAVIMLMCLPTMPQVPLVTCNKCPISIREHCTWAFTVKEIGSFGAHCFYKSVLIFQEVIENFLSLHLVFENALF